MAYGFGSTFGTGSTDKIQTTIPSPTGARTYFIRFLRNGGGGGNLGRFFEAHNGTVNELWDWNVTNNRIDYFRAYSGASQAMWWVSLPTSGVWTSIALTKDFATTTAPLMYIDGSSVTVTTATAASGTPTAITSGICLGNRPTDNARHWDGLLADFYVWNAVLTAGEIASLHAGADPTTIQDAQLIARIPMDTDALDREGNYTTTITGAQLVAGPRASADLASSYEIAAPGTTSVSADLSSSYTILAQTTTIASPADRGNIRLSTSDVQNQNTLTPNVRLKMRVMVNEQDGDPVAKQFFWYGQTNGVDDKTPTYQVQVWSSASHSASTELLKYLHVSPFTPGTYKPVWSYDARNWSYFDNCSWNADGLNLDFSNNSPFNQDTVYVATAFPWQESLTAEWIASLSSPYLSEPPSAVAYAGDPYQFGVTSSRTNELSESIAACKLYSLRIGTAGNAPDGYPKRHVVLASGIHAGEDLGNFVLAGAVEFLLSEDTKAQTWRQWFTTTVYPMLQPSGRRGGHWRSDFDAALLTANSNRYWGLNTLATINAHEDAITLDTGDDFVALFDYHAGHIGAPYSNMHSNANVTTWTNALRVYRPGITINANNVPGSTATWAAAVMGADFGCTPEYNWGYTNTIAHAEAFGADTVKALSDIAAAGFWEITPVSADSAPSYLVRAAASADTSPTYDIRAAVATELAAAYSVTGPVAADNSASYNIQSAVAADSAAAYNLRASVQTDQIAAYAVQEAVSADLASAYDIQTAGAVASSSTAEYVIRGAVSSDLPAAYNLHAAVAADVEALYALRAAVSADSVAAYDIEASIASVYADLVASYNIEASTIPGGVTAEQIADAVWQRATRELTQDVAGQVIAAAQITPIHSRVKIINNTPIAGAGIPADPMRPA